MRQEKTETVTEEREMEQLLFSLWEKSWTGQDHKRGERDGEEATTHSGPVSS